MLIRLMTYPAVLFRSHIILVTHPNQLNPFSLPGGIGRFILINGYLQPCPVSKSTIIHPALVVGVCKQLYALESQNGSLTKGLKQSCLETGLSEVEIVTWQNDLPVT